MGDHDEVRAVLKTGRFDCGEQLLSKDQFAIWIIWIFPFAYAILPAELMI
jgi:hypothetical protein